MFMRRKYILCNVVSDGVNLRASLCGFSIVNANQNDRLFSSLLR